MHEGGYLEVCHYRATTGSVDWDGLRVLDRATKPIQLKVKEALHIERTPANTRLNCDWCYELLYCWITTMKELGLRLGLAARARLGLGLG